MYLWKFLSIHLNAPFCIVGSIIDELIFTPEEKFFREEVPIDVGNIGGTILINIEDINDLRKLLDDMKVLGKEFIKKKY